MHNVAGVQPFMVQGSAVPVSVTGTGVEVEVGRIVIPPGAFGDDGLLRYTWLASATNNANVKNLRLRLDVLGGTQLAILNIASFALYQGIAALYITPTGIKNMGGFTAGGIATAMLSTAVDWSVQHSILQTLQLASGADTMTKEAYQWEAFRF